MPVKKKNTKKLNSVKDKKPVKKYKVTPEKVSYVRSGTAKTSLSEVNKRTKTNKLFISYNRSEKTNVIVTSSSDAYSFIKENLNYDELDLRESFYCIFLRRNNSVIGMSELFKGGISASIVDLKIILSEALGCLASGIILCHNHPAGTKYPSLEDRMMTKKIKDAAKILEINVLDHLIITREGFYSFADEGIMP